MTDRELKREALMQYLKYFRIWFVVTGVLLAAALTVTAVKALTPKTLRANIQAPAERVYDFAEVLTDEEEQELREWIAVCEEKCQADLILVTTNMPMGLDDRTWENSMMNFADDVYDEGAYGWNRPHGDGALLLDNWYEDEEGSQKGSWLSTSGKMEANIGAHQEGKVFDAMDPYLDTSPYKAYRAAIGKLSEYGGETNRFSSEDKLMGTFVGLIGPFLVAFIYAIIHLNPGKAPVTTTAATYVDNGKPTMKIVRDDFLRKNVTKRRIETSSGGGGGGGSHGGGSHGHHTSSGGHSHGGGGRRR